MLLQKIEIFSVHSEAARIHLRLRLSCFGGEDTTQATVFPPATGVKVRSNGQGRILKAGQAVKAGIGGSLIGNGQRLSRRSMGVVNARVKARCLVRSRGQARNFDGSRWKYSATSIIRTSFIRTNTHAQRAWLMIFQGCGDSRAN